MKKSLAIVAVFLFAAVAFAFTGDEYFTGNIRVGGDLKVDSSISGDAWNLAISAARLATGAVTAIKIASNVIGTTKLLTIASSDSGKVMCAMNDGTIGKCNTGITAVSCLCEAF